MKINRKISPYNYSSGNSIKYIVIHSTGNVNDTAKNNADYFYGGDRNASAHYFVDDNQIWQVVEEYNQAWHCGDGGNVYGIGNNNSIGIEMCGTANGYISEQTINNTIQLVKQLMSKYGVSVTNVVTHYNASRKNCPSQFSPNNWARWNNFKSRLSGGATMNKNEGVVVADTLNVRNKPNGNIIGMLSNGDIIRIDKKVDNWYSIFYGNNGGYVSADYVKTNYNKPKEQPKQIKSHRNCIVYAKGADIDGHIANCFGMYLEDCIVVDHTQYVKGMGRSVYSVGALKGIECDVAIRGKDRRDTFEKAMSRVGFKR